MISLAFLIIIEKRRIKDKRLNRKESQKVVNGEQAGRIQTSGKRSGISTWSKFLQPLEKPSGAKNVHRRRR